MYLNTFIPKLDEIDILDNGSLNKRVTFNTFRSVFIALLKEMFRMCPKNGLNLKMYRFLAPKGALEIQMFVCHVVCPHYASKRVPKSS